MKPLKKAQSRTGAWQTALLAHNFLDLADLFLNFPV